MPKPITIKIDVMKIQKQHLYEGRNGAKYLNLAVWENRDGPGQYGDTHYCVQEISKEARDAGEKGPIVGNMKMPEQEKPKAPPRSQPAGPDRNRTTDDSGDGEVPF